MGIQGGCEVETLLASAAEEAAGILRLRLAARGFAQDDRLRWAFLSRSISDFSRLHPREPFGGEIDPVRVAAFEEGDFPDTRPAFQLRFARKGFVDVIVRFEVEQPNDIVAGRECFVVMEFVLEDAFVKIATDSDVEGAGCAGHDIDAVVVAVAHGKNCYARQ